MLMKWVIHDRKSRVLASLLLANIYQAYERRERGRPQISKGGSDGSQAERATPD